MGRRINDPRLGERRRRAQGIFAQEVFSSLPPLFSSNFCCIVPCFIVFFPFPLASSKLFQSGEHTGILEESPIHAFALFKSGEHTCKVFKQQKKERTALDQQPIHRRIHPCMAP
ncbi:unnamed protein product [Victoria cruziana]